MEKNNVTSGQVQNTNTGLPISSSLSYESGQSNPGREYGKEFMRWAGIQLKGAGRRLKTLFIRVTTRIPKWKLNDVDTDSLNKRMSKINWNKDYYSPEAIARSERSPRLQRDIMRVNSIFRDLKKLSDNGHYMGEELRWKLQYKYWTNTRMQPQTGNTINIVLPPNKMVWTNNNIQANNQQKGESINANTTSGKAVDVLQKQQENEARRRKIAYGGSRLATAVQNSLRRRKKGLSL